MLAHPMTKKLSANTTVKAREMWLISALRPRLDTPRALIAIAGRPSPGPSTLGTKPWILPQIKAPKIRGRARSFYSTSLMWHPSLIAPRAW